MKIIVSGCGKIGTNVVSQLVSEGHDVVCIDPNRSVIEELTNIYDVMGVCGNGADSDVLKEAGVSKAELYVSLAGSDELNMLSCFLAKSVGAPHAIARIRNPEYNDRSLGFLRSTLKLDDSVNPEALTAKEIYDILKFPSAVNIESFSGRNFEMIELKLKADTPLDGMRLMDLRKKYQEKFLVCAVQRENQAFIPSGQFVLRGGDKIGLTASPTEIQKLLKTIGILQKQARNVMILGGSTTAFYLAKLLVAGGNSVTVIEKNRERCLEFSRELPQAVVICGDGAQQELLLEEGIDNMDAFVSLTGMDEENILISCFAASRKVPTVITKVNREEFYSMAERLGLDCIVSPKKTTGDIITRYARALENSLGSSVETLYKLMDGSVEALEFLVQPDFEYLDIPLKEMHFKQNILIAGIIRGRMPIIPAGNDVIKAGDKVVVFASGMRLQTLSDIIA